MGCFTVLWRKKKKDDQNVHMKRILPQESTPTILPEPRTRTNALHSAPPSFQYRINPVQPMNKVTNYGTRALSASSSFHGSEREYEDQEQRSSSPQPLPLPSHQCSGALRSFDSFKSVNSSGPLCVSGPLPLPPSRTLRNFSFKELNFACDNFSLDNCLSESFLSATYKASFWDASCNNKKIEATITRFYPLAQGMKEFINDISTLASLHHPNLCKLLGYHAREGCEHRMLVFERLHHGSLDRLLYGRSDGPPIDWNARVKVALCAAQGLTFLHEEGPFQAMYNEFSAVNIQIDKDFSAKISGYGCIGLLPEAELSDTSPAIGNLSLETLERGLVTPKSNVYSFGIVLIELLTGKKNMSSHQPKEERNLVKWSWPFLADDSRLSLIMDPQLKGRFPIKGARTVASVAQRCLHKDPSERPTMRTVVVHLKTIQDIRHSCLFPLQEPETVVGNKQMFRSPSLPPRPSFSQSSHLRKLDLQESRRSSSSAVHRTSVEGL